MVTALLPAEPGTRASPSRSVPTALVGALTVAYVAVSARWLAAPIGLSHDGRNTAMFALAARAMDRLGLVGSHAGAVLADGNGSYAHHPPSLVWAIRICQAALGEAPWTARLPTFLASIAVIWLLYGLLQDVGVRPLAAATGTAVAVANPMFLVFAWMTDTPMWSLPFALVATRCWVRAGRDDTGRLGPTAAVLAAALCAVSGWQAVAWCGLLVLAGWRGRRRVARSIVLGAALGLAVTAAWIAASPAGLHGLADAFSTRTAGREQGLTAVDSARANWTYLRQLWSPVVLVLGLPALWVAAHERRARRVLAVCVVGVVGYSLLFWEASGIHWYWNLWAVVPVAVAFGVAVDRLVVPRVSTAVVVGVLAVVLLLGAVQPSPAQAQLEQGIRLGRVVADTPLPRDQPGWLVASLVGSESWISYVSDRPARVITDRAALRRVASQHPSWLIVLPCRNEATPDGCAVMGRSGEVVNGVAVTTVSAALAALDG